MVTIDRYHLPSGRKVFFEPYIECARNTQSMEFVEKFLMGYSIKGFLEIKIIILWYHAGIFFLTNH